MSATTNIQLQHEIQARKRAEALLKDKEAQIQHLNQQLKESNQQKNELLSHISHELRTPLTTIIGYTSLTLNELKGKILPEQIKKLVKTQRAAQNLAQLINDVLDFSRIETGAVKTSIETCNLHDITEEVLIIAQGLLLDKSIEFKTEIEPDLPFIKSDFIKIRQILNTLLGNVLKFSEEGRVTLRAKFIERDACIHIEIEDTGAGIPEEHLRGIYQSFEQGGHLMLKQLSGAGLGLAITKKFAEMLDIEIGVERHAGQGTRFWLHIPVQSECPEMMEKAETKAIGRDAEVSALQKAADEQQPGFQSILIIDDEELNLDLMEDIFQIAGYLVYRSKSGQDGIEVARAKKPDVILMDLAMPGMDGYETTQALKGSSETEGIPVIICSALSPREFREKASQTGCQGYLTKPIRPDQVVEQVTKIIRQS